MTFGKRRSAKTRSREGTAGRARKSRCFARWSKNIWVHLTYQTAFVDEDGKLQLREDVYGRDARMIAILKGSERKVADIAIERRPDASSKPVRMPVGTYGGGGGYSNGDGFFGFLFGGPRQSPPRLTAQKSTGPKTVMVKQQSRRNAIRHGLTSETIIDVVEGPANYEVLERFAKKSASPCIAGPVHTRRICMNRPCVASRI